MFFPYSFWTLSQDPHYGDGGDGTTGIDGGTLLVGLVAYYKFDAVNGTDSIGNFNMSAINNPAKPISGILASGAAFTGASSIGDFQVSDPSATLSMASGLTIAGWMIHAPGGIGNSAYISRRVSPGNTSDWLIGNFGISTPIGGLSIGSTNSGIQIVRTTVDRPTGVWYFFAASFDPNISVAKIQINNSTAGSATCDVGAFRTVAGTFKIADENFSTQTAYDEIGIWNRVLSLTEIALLYNAGVGKTYPFS